jgi:hypothetical protein
MLLNGALLRVFGYDIVVARALGAVTALGAAGLLFWIGTRLRDKLFGLFCAVAFLVYAESVMNFRWVRSHPLAGTLALACVGFLVRYVQELKLRDMIWAGVMCALATATHYFVYPLIGAVVVTALVANLLAKRYPVVPTLVGGAVACSYAALFVLWYTMAHGWPELMAQVTRLNSVAGNQVQASLGAEITRLAGNLWRFAFQTPTHGPPPGWSGRDWWLVIASLGFVFLPVKDWKMRLWVPFWLLVLMFGVFRKLDNVPMFFYPATVFLPLMAIGFAGVVTWAGRWGPRALPGAVVTGIFGLLTLNGAFAGFQSKIDLWAQQSVPDAEAALAFVNARVAPDDLVIVPKQIYWLPRTARRSMLTYCARYKGVVNDMPVPVEIPRDRYWFDPSLENAKFVVLEYGMQTVNLPDGRSGQMRIGIDAVYTSGLRGVPEVLQQILQQEKWPLVFQQGLYSVFANPRMTPSK